MPVSVFATLLFIAGHPDDLKKEPEYVAEVKAIQKQTQQEQAKICDSEFEKKYEALPAKERDALLLQAAEKSRQIFTPAVKRVFELILPHAKEPEAVDGLSWVIERTFSDVKIQEQAAQLLRTHHLVHPKVIDLIYNYKQTGLPWVSAFLRDQLNSPYLPSEQRYRVLASLAVNLQRQTTMPMMREEFPGADWKKITPGSHAEGVNLTKADVEMLEAESIKRFTELKDQYSEKDLRGVNCGKLAESSIFEIRQMKVGMPAPELAGEDLDGVKFKLSDYRGKVVMVSFWATWCGPCMALVPHEKEIVERFKERPFALIGVNADPFKKTVLKTVEKEKINWRSFWCGKKGPNADLPMSWNVTGWPTVYVIDHDGIIRVKHGTHVGTALDDRIEELVKIAESKAKK